MDALSGCDVGVMGAIRIDCSSTSGYERKDLNHLVAITSSVFTSFDLESLTQVIGKRKVRSTSRHLGNSG